MIVDYIYNKRTIIGSILILIILIGSGILFYSFNKNQEGIATNEISDEITIDIEGAVKNPGVYRLKNGSLIQDAINIAGGLTDKTDNELLAQNINRAEILKDNQKIFIPLVQPVSQSVAGTQTSDSTQARININTASLEQLDSLPGIGPVYAQRIIDYRKKKQFSSIEEIMEIQGIGEKTFSKFMDLITI